MKPINRIFFFIILICLAVPLQAQNSWTLEDVNRAHREGRYEELMFRILDVPPSQRNVDWALAYKGCVKYQIRNSRGMLNPNALQAMRGVLPNSELDAEFQYDIAKYIYQSTGASSAAVPWYAEAITTRNEGRLCRDSQLHQAVLSVLRYEAGDSTAIRGAQKLTIICMDELLPVLKSVVADSDLVFFQNVCPYLKRQLITADYESTFALACQKHGF